MDGPAFNLAFLQLQKMSDGTRYSYSLTKGDVLEINDVAQLELTSLDLNTLKSRLEIATFDSNVINNVAVLLSTNKTMLCSTVCGPISKGVSFTLPIASRPFLKNYTVEIS